MAEPPDASEVLTIFPKFSYCNFNLSLKFEGRPPRQKIIIQYFQDTWVRGAKPPERQRKFKIFTEKSEDFYEILKELSKNSAKKPGNFRVKLRLSFPNKVF